jgi:hypothetical protein
MGIESPADRAVLKHCSPDPAVSLVCPMNLAKRLECARFSGALEWRPDPSYSRTVRSAGDDFGAQDGRLLTCQRVPILYPAG